MRLTRKKLTARDLMIAVLAFALSLKLGLAYSRSAAYWREARFHGKAAESFRFYAGLIEGGKADQLADGPGGQQGAAEGARRFAAQSDRRRAKYLRAAFLPWLPGTPEPPDL